MRRFIPPFPLNSIISVNMLVMKCCILAPCETGEVRLVGGNVPYEGRVEICLDNEWGSICDISWDEADASVICARLDYLTDGK